MKNFNTVTIAILLLLILFSCTDTEPSITTQEEDNNYVYGNNPLQTFKLYKPSNFTQDTEVVILVHGGGWVMGYHPDEKVTTFDGRFGWNLLQPLLDAGYACAVMKYRTACYNTVPTEFQNNTMYYLDQMIEDINLVINFIRDNNVTLNVANNQFHLIGESAGSHIVTAYGINANADPDLKSVVSMFAPTNLDSPEFKQQINSFPLIFATAPNYFLKQSDNCQSVTNKQVRILNSLKSFADHSEILIDQPNPFLTEISNTTLDNIQNNIPLFIMQGENDILVPQTQAQEMYDAMQTKFLSPTCIDNSYNCQLKLKIYENCGHGWVNSDTGICNKNQIMNDIVNWINNH